MKTIDIKGNPYVMTHERVKEFHKLYPNGSITTELLSEVNSNRIVMKTTVIPDVKNPEHKFTGHAQEMIGDGFINKASALENCETSVIGRALGACNIGILEGFASADEIAKATDMSKAPSLNKPTSDQLREMASLLKELGIHSSPDSNEEYTQLCLDAIGVPAPLNRDQVETLIAFMQERIMDKDAIEASKRDV